MQSFKDDGTVEKQVGPTASGDDIAAEDVALRRTLLYVVLPFWLLPGIADWYWHKRSDIEHTSGTHESLTHVLMMAAIGTPITAALIFDINALVIASMLAGCILHEGITIWDVAYAQKRRTVTNIEVHTHSFLEVMPFAATALVVCLKPKQFASVFGKGSTRARWRLEPKTPSLSIRYVGTILTAAFIFVAVPYAEEFIRCFRVDKTLLPRRRDDDPAFAK